MKLPLLFTSLADSATHHPNDVAITSETTIWSYAMLWTQIARFESAVSKLALPTGVAVAVTAHKTVNTLALMLALGKQGHTPLAVSPSLGVKAKPTVYASARVFCELAAGSDHNYSEVMVVVPSNLQADAAPKVYTAVSCPLMLTTSGSTGIPKVVELSAEGIHAFFHWGAEYFNLTRGSRVLSYAPLNFDLSLLEVWAPLAQGATVILGDTTRATQAGYLRTLIHDQQPDLIQAVPMFYNLLCPEGDAYTLVMEGVRHVVFTGDTTPKGLRDRAAAAFPQATFHNIYGCTETNDSFVYSGDAQAIVRHERLPLGSPISGVAYRIVTEEGTELNISQTESFFAGVFCHDMVKNGKPSPDLVNLALRDLDLDKSQVMVVGDSTSDIEMANKAKVEPIVVTWEVSMPLDFPRANCTNIAESWEDLTIQLGNFFMHTTGGWNGHYTTD